MKKLFYLLFLSIVIISCKDKKDDTQTLVFENKEYKTIVDNGEGTTEVLINVPVITTPNNTVYNTINTVLLNEIIEIVSFDSDISGVTTYEDLVASFVQTYNEFLIKFPEDNLPWKAKVKATTSFYNDHILAIDLEYYTFAGGAHGYNGKKSLLFDLQLGQVLKQGDLYRDWESIGRLLSSKLAYINELKDSKGVVNFPEDTFIYQDKVVMTYANPSDFPFSEGVDEVVFTKEEIAPYFKIDITVKKEEK